LQRRPALLVEVHPTRWGTSTRRSINSGI
jgi:hypothetical protein